jgi:hypothetical protein
VPLKLSWSQGNVPLPAYRQKVLKPKPAGSVPGELARFASHSGLA